MEIVKPKKNILIINLLRLGDIVLSSGLVKGLKKRYARFQLEVEHGSIHEGEVVGILGPNATGKTTLVKMLSGEIRQDSGSVHLMLNKKAEVRPLKVSYKPQYLRYQGETHSTDSEMYNVAQILHENSDSTVAELIMREGAGEMAFYRSQIKRPLRMEELEGKVVQELSGGELQRVAIALSLLHPADLYLLDEPSAYLDSNQRMEAARCIRAVMETRSSAGLIVDHDIYFIDIMSDSIMVFSGTPGEKGYGNGPYGLRKGMNLFLQQMAITFRRDHDTKRPRINTEGSRLDREQKSSGEYFYSE